MREKILVFIPGYNCEKQIVRVLKQFDENVLKHIDEIIFVNNRSTDNTEKAVLDYKRERTLHPNCLLFLRRRSAG